MKSKGHKDINKKILHQNWLPSEKSGMKNVGQHLVFITCVLEGRLKADHKTIDKYNELTVKMIQKAGMKLVKRGFLNVNDGVFTPSKMGSTNYLAKRILKQKNTGKINNIKKT